MLFKISFRTSWANFILPFFIIIIKPISCVILVISFGNFEVLLEYGCLRGTEGGGKKKGCREKNVRMGMLKKVMKLFYLIKKFYYNGVSLISIKLI